MSGKKGPETQPENAPPPEVKGRRGSETRKKTIPVTSRYDEAEFAELEESASRAGLTRASYQRVQSLTKPRTRSTRRPPLERELLAQLLGQVGRVGGNLHQLVRHLNGGGEADLRQLGEVLGALDLLKREIMAALGRQETRHRDDRRDRDDP